MQEKISKISVSEILERLMLIFQVDTQTKLAEKLSEKQGVVSGWKTRNSIDLQDIIEKIEYVDLNWLIYGIDPEVEKKEEKTSDISSVEEKNEIYGAKNTQIEDYLREENKYLKEDIALKNDLIKHLQEGIEMYRTGKVIVITPKSED